MQWFKKWRRSNLSRRKFPAEWESIVQKNVPYYNRISGNDKKEFQTHTQILLSEKTFEGCNELEITDEITVTIAAFASILLMHRQTDYYPRLTTILVYPQAYVVPNKEHLPGGVVAEGIEVREGESWSHGIVVLSWQDIQKASKGMAKGHNVVLHEFAHQIDTGFEEEENSQFLSDLRGFSNWLEGMQADFEQLKNDAIENRYTFLDKYGALNEAEFFAVATEFFFEIPKEFQKAQPNLYHKLKIFYNQDPATIF
jgi:Mlc titration factor MtfA (ptsG expression regulator)